MNAYPILDVLSTPVWILQAETGTVEFANQAALKLSPHRTLLQMRNGLYSATPHPQLATYSPSRLNKDAVVEIWTVGTLESPRAMPCRLSVLDRQSAPTLLLAEGLSLVDTPASLCADSKEKGSGPFDSGLIYHILSISNTAPMLLIDVEDDGRIVDANAAAQQFYGYPHGDFTRLHTWEINAQGRDILPVMREIAKLPGGHKPLHFVHRLADGSLRDVQTYAGPFTLNGKRLMLCIIHDITEQTRLKNELEQAALRDPLTGLWNRRHILRQLEQVLMQKRQFGQDFSLALLDIDDFKSINDHHGHFTGDEVLVCLARTLEQRIRESDLICRWGGEEFLILLPQTRLDSAVYLAECLRNKIEHTRFPHPATLTVSMGVAQYQEQETLETLIMRVDGALYQAKSMGRNRVVSTGPDTIASTTAAGKQAKD